MNTAAFANKVGKTETYQDMIEKAYTLSLQKDRSQAISLLVSATRKESKKGPVPKELLSSLDEVSEVFYSDKAQQLHELALSLRMTEPGLATQKLNEAARLEPENSQIQFALLRQQISAADCDGAYKSARKGLESNPFSEEFRLIAAQAAICNGQLADVQSLKSAADQKRNSLELFWQMVELEQAFRSSQFTKGREQASTAQKTDPAFPESSYWLWKLSSEQKLPADRAGQKYLALCKSLSSRTARKYIGEPRLCRRTAEVEAELKKNSSPGVE